MKIVWGADAQHQLMGILHTIGADNALTAATWLHTLNELLQNAAEFPESGRVIPEFDDEQMREVIHGSYRVGYVIQKKSIEVLSIWHGSRRPPGRGLAGEIGYE